MSGPRDDRSLLGQKTAGEDRSEQKGQAVRKDRIERENQATQPPQEPRRRNARRLAIARSIPLDAPADRRRLPHNRTTLAIGAATALLVLSIGVGAFALFLDRSTTAASVTAGTVSAEFDPTGATALSVPVAGLVPGGSVLRILRLTNVGTVPIAALQLEFSTPGISASDGVQFTLERCSQPWSSDSSTCSGTLTTVVADRPAASARIDLPDSPAFAVGATDSLRLTLRLPESAPNAAQNTSSSLAIVVTGIQRPGLQR